jgi:hypothetical protein
VTGHVCGAQGKNCRRNVGSGEAALRFGLSPTVLGASRCRTNECPQPGHFMTRGGRGGRAGTEGGGERQSRRRPILVSPAAAGPTGGGTLRSSDPPAPARLELKTAIGVKSGEQEIPMCNDSSRRWPDASGGFFVRGCQRQTESRSRPDRMG